MVKTLERHRYALCEKHVIVPFCCSYQVYRYLAGCFALISCRHYLVQRHGDVGMSHDVLQVFGVHSSLGKPSAESVSHGMGRDVRQGLIRFVVLVVLPDKPLEHALVSA